MSLGAHWTFVRHGPRAMRLVEARELVDLLDGAGRHDCVAVLRFERWLRARGYDHEADRVA